MRHAESLQNSNRGDALGENHPGTVSAHGLGWMMILRSMPSVCDQRMFTRIFAFLQFGPPYFWVVSATVERRRDLFRPAPAGSMLVLTGIRVRAYSSPCSSKRWHGHLSRWELACWKLQSPPPMVELWARGDCCSVLEPSDVWGKLEVVWKPSHGNGEKNDCSPAERSAKWDLDLDHTPLPLLRVI